MPYYIEGDAETDFLVINKPEEIKLLDPACGSGHMLTYAFDLLVLIYEEEGYSPNEIPGLILKNNLHGLEICPRAAQLAELALVFKAREQSRRFFQPEQLARPQIIELQDVRFEEGELNDYIEVLDLVELFDPNVFKLLYQFEEAKNFWLAHPAVPRRTGHRQRSPHHRGKGSWRPALPARDAPQTSTCSRTSHGAHPAVPPLRGQSAVYGTWGDG